MARIAAVIGRGSCYPLVRAVAKWRTKHCRRRWNGWLRPTVLLVQGLPPESEYRFKHALIQDAAYENLLKSRRQTLHRCTAEVLRDSLPTTAAAEPELLARHFTQAGMTEAAIEWWGTVPSFSRRPARRPCLAGAV